tara:strand:+ start:13550 stop:14710 length:1161 start_codon:yes stop_codon:yes gene_type:complete
MATYDKEKVMIAANGRWPEIVQRFSTKTFDKKVVQRFGNHGACPHHGGSDGFRFFKDFTNTGGGVCNTCGAFPSGILLLSWLNNIPINIVINELGEYLGVEPEPRRLLPNGAYPSRKSGQGWPEMKKPVQKFIPDREIIDPEVVAQQRQRLNDIWTSSVALSHEHARPARLYFDGRGVNATRYENNPFIRFHPELDYWDEETGEVSGTFPALVMMFINQDQKPTNLHRIYLTPQGDKAPVNGDPKKMTKKPDDLTLTGSAIWLTPPTAVIGITEGVETGIAVQAGTGLSVAACGNAVLLERFMPPKEVKIVHNFVDKDRSKRGEEAAVAFRERMAMARPDIQIYDHLPTFDIPSDGKCVDWLDVWNNCGKAGFRHLNLITNLQLAG